MSLTGSTLSQFIAVSTFLHLLDPVRGTPTVHGSDRHPNDCVQDQAYLERFLDSFALILSTSEKGSDTASAVCLEQHEGSGTILRIARNHGADQDFIGKVQYVLDKLVRVSLRGEATEELEKEILYHVITITMDKITSLLERLCSPDVRKTVRHATDEAQRSAVYRREAESSGFGRWISHLPKLVSLPVNADPGRLVPHVMWAARARWEYSEQLTSFLSKVVSETPLWVNTIYKLGRYYSATKAMVRFATRRPEVFRSIRILAVESPEPQTFTLRDKTALSNLLVRIGRAKEQEDIKAQLCLLWSAKGSDPSARTDPEALFRRKCSHKLSLHAEIQLVAFYDCHPELQPQVRFMGTSKKACYLCQQFLSQHWLGMTVSASHQKIWPSWMPPSAAKYKDILWRIKGELERSAARDLQGQLGQRRPINFDSTAGPPITFTSTFWTMPTSIYPRSGQL